MPSRPIAVSSLATLLLVLAACQPAAPPPPAPPKVPVTSAVVEPGPFEPAVELYGVVAPSGRLPLEAGGSGRIRFASRFSEGLRTGASVRTGEHLFTVEDPEAALRLAERRLDLEEAEAELSRAQRGVEEGFLPQARLEEAQIRARRSRERLEAAEQEHGRARSTAPVDGTLRIRRSLVGEAPLAAGVEVREGQVIAELAAAGLPKVEAWVGAGDLVLLRRGLAAECLDSRGQRIVGRGRLEQVDTAVDEAGVARVVMAVETDLGMPRAGEGVRLRALLGEKPAAITLPEAALSIRGNATTVFVLEPSGSDWKASSRLVRTGSSSEGQVEILEGIEPGDRVAVEGSEFLADGLLARDVSSEQGGA
ncbi:MAG: efflux RND transporter periplasmic adaptor subunit [Holophagales bacterium]|nr:efflux RND transporter periplasmic adaptor subunit [Holophagales bacterium]